jgi:hypothetical protein
VLLVALVPILLVPQVEQLKISLEKTTKERYEFEAAYNATADDAKALNETLQLRTGEKDCLQGQVRVVDGKGSLSLLPTSCLLPLSLECVQTQPSRLLSLRHLVRVQVENLQRLIVDTTMQRDELKESLTNTTTERNELRGSIAQAMGENAELKEALEQAQGHLTALADLTKKVVDSAKDAHNKAAGAAR